MLRREWHLQERAKRAYYSIRLAPLAPDVSHLAFYAEENASGPIQREEALFLYGAIRVIRPKTVVEIGFLRGQSALNFLRAMDDDAVLYSFDIDSLAEPAARTIFANDQRLRFTLKSQDKIRAEDVDNRSIDFVLLDASHDLAMNRETFTRIEPLLAPRAILAVHDTGAWSREGVQLSPGAVEYTEQNPGNWLPSGHFAHRPDERKFVNWIRETRPHYAQIHFHAESTLRHGVTLLQANTALPT